MEVQRERLRGKVVVSMVALPVVVEVLVVGNVCERWIEEVTHLFPPRLNFDVKADTSWGPVIPFIAEG